MHHKTKQFVLAFPGMGKTTLALREPGLIDLDYGSFRTALNKAPSDDQTQVMRSFMRLANRYGSEGFIVLSNEPQLLPYLKQSGWDILMVLPTDYTDIHARISARYGDDGQWHGHFLEAMRENQAKWVNDWIKLADRYHVNYVQVKYLSEVLNQWRNKNGTK